MKTDNFQQNLRLLSSYSDSITRICEQVGINRQQFHRYLNGTGRPSLKNMRKICDYYGVEEYEILMDHDAFVKIISLRKPRGPEIDPFGEYISKLHRINPSASRDMHDYLGYYHCYFTPLEFPGKICRSITMLFSKQGFVYTKGIENYASILRRASKKLKYTGIAYHTGERIMVHEREIKSGQMMWTTILYPSNRDQVAILTGLSIGIDSATERHIACYRVVWEALGDKVNLRTALKSCGLFEASDPSIPMDIKNAIDNKMADDEKAFIGRTWQMSDTPVE